MSAISSGSAAILLMSAPIQGEVLGSAAQLLQSKIEQDVSNKNATKLTYFVYLRPGNTEDNIGNKWSDDDATPLTPDSVKKAENMATALKGVKFDAVYISKAKRTSETAEKVNQTVTPTIVDWLYEMEIGPLAGLSRDDVKKFFLTYNDIKLKTVAPVENSDPSLSTNESKPASSEPADAVSVSEPKATSDSPEVKDEFFTLYADKFPKLVKRLQEDGRTIDDLTANDCLLDMWYKDPDEARVSTSEERKIDTYDNYCAKIKDPMITTLTNHVGQTVLLSGHGTPGKLLLSLGSGLEVSRLECQKANFFMGSVDETGKVTLFTVDAKDPIITGAKQNVFLNPK